MTTTIGEGLSQARERQRFEHLVLGRPRPTGEGLKKPKGMPKSEWKIRKDELRREATALMPGIEDQVQLHEQWGGAVATPQTLAAADRRRRRAGSMARLYESKAIDAEQLAAAQEIAEAYEAIGAAVSVRSAMANLSRVDCGFRPDPDAAMALTTLRELTYGRWRSSVEGPVMMVLDIVVDDVGLSAAARAYRMSDRRARAILVGALNLWLKLSRRRR